MILTKYILDDIKAQLNANDITGYIYIAPQTKSYPYVTFLPIAITTEYTFKEVIETAVIQFSIFDNDMDVGRTGGVMDIAEYIETIFEDYASNNATLKIFCTHKIGENGPIYMDKEHYWMHIIELSFYAQRNKLRS